MTTQRIAILAEITEADRPEYDRLRMLPTDTRLTDLQSETLTVLHDFFLIIDRDDASDLTAAKAWAKV